MNSHSKPPKPVKRDFEDNAVNLGLLLSEQDSLYGYNMFDNISAWDEDMVKNLVAHKYSRNEALKIIFDIRHHTTRINTSTVLHKSTRANDYNSDASIASTASLSPQLSLEKDTFQREKDSLLDDLALSQAIILSLEETIHSNNSSFYSDAGTSTQKEKDKNSSTKTNEVYDYPQAFPPRAQSSMSRNNSSNSLNSKNSSHSSSPNVRFDLENKDSSKLKKTSSHGYKHYNHLNQAEDYCPRLKQTSSTYELKPGSSLAEDQTQFIERYIEGRGNHDVNKNEVKISSSRWL